MFRQKALHVIALLLLFNKASFSQLEADHWMFGYQRYVNFNQGFTPEAIPYPYYLTSVLTSGSVTYSDKRTRGLFYFGGTGQIIDRNFEVFPSLDLYTGSPLYTVPGLLNYTQNVLAVPYPGHDSLYILFHIRSDYYNQIHSQLYYTVINMNLRGGLGEIVASQKNIPLLGGADVAFKLTAVLHCNKKDVWVIGHMTDSDQYYSFLVTEAGISAIPVYFSGQFIPRGNPDNSIHPDNKGCIKVSALGNRLAAAYWGLNFIELFDFNTQTGTGNNLKTITAHPPPEDTLYIPSNFHSYGPCGVDFSPTGNKLYVTSNYGLRAPGGYAYAAYLYQFDATLNTESLIQATQYRIDSINGRLGGAIQIGNNGKMYVSASDDLFEIADPENIGAACNYRGLVAYSGQQLWNGNLPTFLQSYFRYPVISTGNCQFQNISFSIQNPVGISNIFWNFGDPASGAGNSSSSFTPTHIFSSEGTYKVTAVLINSNGCGADTVRKIVHAGPFRVDLGNDTTLCSGDTLKLRMNIPGGNNLWSTESRDTLVSITAAGTYWVRVNIGDCVASDTIQVSVNALPSFSLGNDTAICSNRVLMIYPLPDPDGVTYTWNTGAVTPDITVFSAGSYWLQLIDLSSGCKFVDTITVQLKSLPGFSLGSDTVLCNGEILLLNSTVSGANSYSWNTGASTSSIQVYQPGIFWSDVTKDGCTYRDSMSVLFKPMPVVSLGNDTTICEDQSLFLNAGNPGSQYLWQNNSNAQTFMVSVPGKYFAKVDLNGCIASDTIQVQIYQKPVFSLGKDTVICNGMTITLQPTIQNNSGVSWLWNTGNSSSALSVTQPGDFILTGINYCGSRSDQLTVAKGVCRIYMPSAFSPNNDGLNDIFKAEFGENVSYFLLEIYNRWGNKIFSSTDIKKGWNGQSNGILSPNGVYIWLVRYKTITDSKENILRGSVMLVR